MIVMIIIVIDHDCFLGASRPASTKQGKPLQQIHQEQCEEIARGDVPQVTIIIYHVSCIFMYHR